MLLCTSVRNTSQALYTRLLGTFPLHSNSHIHTHFTNIDIQKFCQITILGTPLHKISESEVTLPHEDQVHLGMLHCRHHLALVMYDKNIMTPLIKPEHNLVPSPHSLTHIMTLSHTHTLYGVHWLTVCFFSREWTCLARQVQATKQEQHWCMKFTFSIATLNDTCFLHDAK